MWETQAPAPLQMASQAASFYSSLGIQSERGGCPASPSSRRRQKHLGSQAQHFQETELIEQFPMQNLAGSKLA